MHNGFYYCYSANLYEFLRDHDQRYICVGLNENTLRKFWQYARTPEDRLLTEWQRRKPA